MIKTIKIEDTLHERSEAALNEFKKFFASYVKKNKPLEFPKWRSELNEEGEVDDLISGHVPTTVQEQKDTFYLHGDQLDDLYENLSTGDDPMPNYYKSAIYFFIFNHIFDWYDKEGEAYFYQLTKGRVKK
ncbi:MAG: hypothetical protein EBR82_75805 [Caulobacteraceae bacterium]|nr:hypothetical protein [Caulobacteraceae bacterium]